MFRVRLVFYFHLFTRCFSLFGKCRFRYNLLTVATLAKKLSDGNEKLLVFAKNSCKTILPTVAAERVGACGQLGVVLSIIRQRGFVWGIGVFESVTYT